MKSNLVFILSFIFYNSLFAQEFAVIIDKDGYTNVRSENNTNSKILDKLNNGHLVCIMNPEGNWWNIDYSTKQSEIKYGYIYKDKFKFIAEYEEVPVIKNTESEINFSNTKLKVKIIEKKFEKNKHKLQFVKNYPNQILKIDEKEYWGTDGNVPKTEYKSISIKFNKSSFELPRVALQNLYEPNLYSTKVNYDSKKDIIYVSAMNSDGAGGYLVVWKIEKGKYKERFIAYGF